METYEQYIKNEKVKAQKQANEKYKKFIKSKKKDIAKKSNKMEKRTNAATKIYKSAKKMYGYNPKLSNTLMKFANANQTAGRPKKVYKHTSPLSGKPVPAEVYYSHMRKFKNIQARKIEDAKERRIVEYAKKGYSPEQVANIQQRIKQQKFQQFIKEKAMREQRQSQIQPQRPQAQEQTQQQEADKLREGTAVDKSTRVWKHRVGTVSNEGGAFGRKKKIYGLPSSFWN